ncbi:cyclase family protein [Kitasatospora sp. NPDC051914]|uniref:cyclase family protein n=1 Tax=Kitasatospora sp. NPDC051914 TaxID=3154945 RepID=UPI00341E94D7
MTDRRAFPALPALGADEFRALHERVRRSVGGGGAGRGALELITPERVVAAAREVRSGRRVSLASPVETVRGPDNPEPAGHRMTGAVAGSVGGGLDFARDHFDMNVHGDADSHLDALCHVVWRGTLFGGTSTDGLTADGAAKLSVALAGDGIVGRGVLLDIPRLHGVPWLEPGEQVGAAELAAAEAAQGVRVGAGDLLFVRVGHRRRRDELGPWRAAEARAGLHPTAVEFLADRQVAVLGSDGNNDAAPSTTEGVAFPVHVLAVHAMGLHLLDYLQFEDLAPLCEQERRWSFLCVIAPLRLPAATGSPVNPVAVL